MNTTRNIWTILSLALLAIAGPALAGESASDYSLHLDDLLIDVSEVDVDTSSARFEEYRDVSGGFAVRKLHVTMDGTGARDLDFLATNVGKKDARYRLSYGKIGSYTLDVDYNKIPHRFGNDARTLFTQTSPGRFEIADPIQGALQSAIEQRWAANRNSVNFAFLNGLITPYLDAEQRLDIALQRDRTRARIGLGSLGGMRWAAEYRHEARTGGRPYGATFGFNNVTELPEPIDYDTVDAEITGEWMGKSSAVRFGYRQSKFDNANRSMIWDNPWRLTDATDGSAYQAPGSASIGGASRGQAALAPDNDMDSLFASGNFRIGKAWLAASAGYTVMRQDEKLLAYTLNSAIPALDLPAESADREVRVLNGTADFKLPLTNAWDLKLKYRFYDYGDNARRLRFEEGYVRYHGVLEDIGRITVPVEYSRQTIGLETSYDFGAGGNLELGIRRDSMDRERREIESADEDVLSLAYDVKPLGWLGVRLAVERGDRSTSTYHVEAQEESFIEPEGINNLPTLRKFDEAARTYDRFTAQLDFAPGESWSVTVGADKRKDDYDESEFGLLSDDFLAVHAELAWAPSESGELYLFGNRSDREVQQRARQSGATLSTNPLDTWEATFEEKNDAWGLGWRAKAGRWSYDLSGTWTKSDGLADLFSPPGGSPDLAVGFDNYEDIELLSLVGKLDYEINAQMTVGVAYRYEDFTIDSFILQALDYYLPGALLLNGNNGDYQADIASVYFKLRF